MQTGEEHQCHRYVILEAWSSFCSLWCKRDMPTGSVDLTRLRALLLPPRHSCSLLIVTTKAFMHLYRGGEHHAKSRTITRRTGGTNPCRPSRGNADPGVWETGLPSHL